MNVSLSECFSLYWKCFIPIWGQTPVSPHTAYLSEEVNTRFYGARLVFFPWVLNSAVSCLPFFWLWTILQTVAGEKNLSPPPAVWIAINHWCITCWTRLLFNIWGTLSLQRRSVIHSDIFFKQTLILIQSFIILFFARSAEYLLLKRDWSTADELLDVFEMELCELLYIYCSKTQTFCKHALANCELIWCYS